MRNLKSLDAFRHAGLAALMIGLTLCFPVS